ncbi:MAG: hypothetical protein M1838_001706 [Thelocarpon superellum]|nr:MAG: hypothetical protein M1838_001706 [Thelocarpon superellum]
MAHHNHHHHRRSLGPQVMPELGHVLGHLDTRNPATIVSVVYVTAAPTFSGPVAGYTTIGAAPQPSQHDSSTSSPGQQQAGPPSELQSQNNQQSEQNGHSAQSAQSQSASSGSQSPSSPSATSADSPSSLSLASSTSPSAISPVSSSNTDSALSNIVPPTISSSPSTSASSDTASTTSSSMSTGSIIGIIAGVLIGLGLLSALGFVLYRRKLAQRDGYAKTEDEKPAMSSSGDPFGTAPFGTARAPSTRSVRTASTAPRLSLRPVTQFDPNLGRNVAGPPQQLAPSFRGGNPQPVQQRRLNDPNNPFGNHAEPSNQDGPPMSGPAAAAVSPVNAMMAGPGPNIPRGPNGPTGPNGTAHPMDKAANASFLDMHSSMSSVNSLPEPGMRRPASPTASEYSTTSAMTTGTAAGVGAAAGAMGAGRAAPGGSSGSPVHRIQLDFKPSMEDELELKAGQLVRLLHEYDDGWVRHFLLHHLDTASDFMNRPCAFVLTDLNKVSRRGPASRLDR